MDLSKRVAPMVAVTADRRGSDQVLMLTRLGLRVIHGPAVRTEVVHDSAQLRQVTEALIIDPPEYLVANTGIGMRIWLEIAESWDMRDALTSALSHTRIAARGPKVAGACAIAGLRLWWRAPSEQLAGVADRLVDEGIVGSRIALQLHGQDDLAFRQVLGDAGATVIDLPVYRWHLPTDAAPALELIESVCRGEVDAITFTAGPAVRNLMAIAELELRSDDLLKALNSGRVLVACVGPVCSQVAREVGIDDPVMPEHWRLGSLVRMVGERLGVLGREPDETETV